MINPFSKIKLKLQKSLMATLTGLVSMLFGFILTDNPTMVFWIFWSVLLISSMLGLTKTSEFVASLLEAWLNYQTGKSKIEEDNRLREEERETIRALRPTNDNLVTALKKDMERSSSNTPTFEDLDKAKNDQTGEVFVLKQQLDQAKTVIETQNKIIEEQSK